MNFETLPAKITCTSRPQLWPWGYAIEFSLRKTVEEGKLAALCRDLVAEVLPLEAITGRPLTDIKGVNQPLELELTDAIALPPETDEIFYLRGCATCQEENKKGETESVRKEFEYRITTSFLDFPGAHHIRHSARIITDGAWPAGLSIALLNDSIPLELHYLRLGLEFFRSRFISGTLGFAPSVWQSIIFEASGKEICLKLQAEGVKRDFELFPAESAAGRLAGVLQRVFSVAPCSFSCRN